jgi:hypothetical protein
VFHLMTHAFFKALLFLGAGSVIHAMHHEQDIFKMGGLKKKMPITRWTFLIGTMAIAGVPYLSGFYSKDAILWEVHTTQRLIPIPGRAVALFVDGERQYVGGRNGTILRGEGERWTEETVPVAAATIRGVNHAILPDIRAIASNGSGTYWAAAAYGTVYRSGGKGWTLAQPGGDDPAHLNAAWAVPGADEAWFVGDRGLVLHWTGTEFQKVAVGTTASLTAIVGRSATEVYAAGASGTLLKFDGKAWAPAPGIGGGNIIGLVAAGPSLVGATEKGDLLVLGAGPAATWTKAALNAPGLGAAVQLRSIAARADGQVVLAGRGKISGGEGVLALAFRGTPEKGFSILTGPRDVLFHGAAFGAEGLLVTSDDDPAAKNGPCALYTAGNEATQLSVVADVPTKPWFHQILWVMATLGALLTAFYMFRLYFLTFEGETRADPEVYAHCHENPPAMVIPLILLAVLSISGGWLEGSLREWTEPVFRTAASRLHMEHHHGIGPWIPTVFGTLGIGLAVMWYWLPSNTPKVLAERFPFVYRVLNNKFYVDEFYHLVVVTPFRKAAKFSHEVIDRVVIDGALVHGSAAIWNALGRALRRLQTGNVQHYAVAVAVGLAILVWFVGMKPTLW